MYKFNRKYIIKNKLISINILISIKLVFIPFIIKPTIKHKSFNHYADLTFSLSQAIIFISIYFKSMNTISLLFFKKKLSYF